MCQHVVIVNAIRNMITAIGLASEHKYYDIVAIMTVNSKL